MNDSFLRELFGSPEEGTFFAWLADGGLWALLIVFGAVAMWFLVRRVTQRRMRRADAIADHQEGGDGVRSAAVAANGLLIGILSGVILAVAAIAGILIVLGSNAAPFFDATRQAWDQVGEWLLTHGTRILLILGIGWVASRVARRVIPRVITSFTVGQTAAADHDEAVKRADTLTVVLMSVANTVIIIIVLFTVLSLLAVPVGPVLGGLGIAGIAVGFGAQHLVRDLITGLFILAENQYRQGDVVEVAGMSGLVESINLRRTVLRDLDGKVHVIPHGEISITTNFTKHWSRIHMDIGVAYKENMDHVFRILNQIGEELAADPHFGLLIIDPPKVLRLNAFDDSSLTIKMLGVCKPMTQWEIMGEMRKRIKETFDREGIEIPFPHRTIYWGADQVKLPWDQSSGPNGPDQPTADDFMPPSQMTPEEREKMLAEMALTAAAMRDRVESRQANQEPDSNEGPASSDESRIIADTERLPDD